MPHQTLKISSNHKHSTTTSTDTINSTITTTTKPQVYITSFSKNRESKERETRERGMETYMVEKWKLSKKGSRNAGRRAAAAGGGGGDGENGLFSKGVPMGPHMSPMGLKPRASGRPARPVSGRFARLVKEQRARFYIMRRCVSMLVCWREY